MDHNNKILKKRKITMNEIRFFYEIKTKKIYNCERSSHNLYYLNKKLELPFDDYIRGIINKNVCYIRIFYPFDDIIDLNLNDLLIASSKLINKELSKIKQALLNEYNFKGSIKINVTNEDLKDKLKTNFV